MAKSITNARGFIPAKLPLLNKSLAQTVKWLDEYCLEHWPPESFKHRDCIDCMAMLHDKQPSHALYHWLESTCTEHWSPPCMRRMDCLECMAELGEKAEGKING